ncbi:hypothetical protein CKN53_13845 [Acinetobacter baumannii]|uniref:Uncharacterized protein n=2 Tax=Acinetobacter baumannii TaxID=470 RepID=A0A242SL22_ACIBA|nr:hypothetical protein B7L41_04940 [Acinetobacter baumannii]ASF49746.1 hypothetical protein AB57_05170 [Acinetobacter baumannii AB0057]PSE14048.1 hypothetical protein C7G95_13760 [Acinetobacter nosocomialis]PXA51598.1 hypothetical protein DMB35_10935 [Acinetobacter baumannii A424]AVN13265.1 hypothetical protein C6N18_03595 [Acinetobacter baumannii]
MVAERKWVDRLIVKNQHAQGVPLPSYRNKKGGRVYLHRKTSFQCTLLFGLSKPAGNVGQQAKDNAQYLRCQSSID